MRIAVLTLVGTVAIAPLPQAHAYPRFVATLPNGANVKGIVALGHVRHAEGGGARNAFGNDFASAGSRWSTALCQADSDGDGQTNGQELGDPCCSWVETTNLAYIRGVSDPSDPASMVNPIIYQGIQCTKSEAAVEAANRQAKKTKKPKATKPAPTTKATVDGESDGDSGSGSGSSSTALRKDGQGNGEAPKTVSGSTRKETAMAATTAITVGLAVAWAML